jgi:hypothetical protein
MENPQTEAADPETPAALRRIRRNALAAYAGFAIFIGFYEGLQALVGLTCSAAVAMISFLWLEEIVNAILQSSALPQPGRLTRRTIARFLLLGVALLVTLFVARFNALSVLLGFSIVVVGIIGEALYSTIRSFRTD